MTTVGIVSVHRAQWLGMAASVAGGAVLTDTAASRSLRTLIDDELNGRDGLIAIGDMPDGTPVADLATLDASDVLARLQHDAWALNCLYTRHPVMGDYRDAVVGMLGIARRLLPDVEPARCCSQCDGFQSTGDLSEVGGADAE